MTESNPTITAAPGVVHAAPASRRSKLTRKILRNPSVIIGSVIVLLLVLIAVFAPVLAPMNPLKQDLFARYEAPQGLWLDGKLNTQFVLGADELGRDVLSRIIMGTRVSLQVGLVATGLSLLLGVVLGAVAGYAGRQADNVIMRLMDILLAIPGILLAIAIVAALGPSIVNAMIAIAIARVPQMARLIRSEVLALREEEFVESARALGTSHVTILFKHILRNAWAPALVLATLGMGTAIVTEASLSFLGLGTQPPQISWGRMLSVGRDAIRSAPHVTLYPGLAIAMVVLAFNLLGDGLRDVFDTRLKDN
jgi:ABC-type dipeptide/oligopeptide/nickel transport system permease subunit